MTFLLSLSSCGRLSLADSDEAGPAEIPARLQQRAAAAKVPANWRAAAGWRARCMTRSPRSVTATAGVDQGAAGGEGGVGGRRNKLRRRTPKKAMGNQTVTRRLQFSG